jgi:hypothetical protein
MGHDGPKLAQGPLWAQTWAPRGDEEKKKTLGINYS